MAMLLAKRQIALHWGSANQPTIKGWNRDLQNCNTASDDYATHLPLPSRPRDIWKPLKDYLLAYPTAETTG